MNFTLFPLAMSNLQLTRMIDGEPEPFPFHGGDAMKRLHRELRVCKCSESA